jgi:superfamily I DNA and/or RNA helicase
MYKNRKGLAQQSRDVVILTFYNAQRRRLFNALSELAVELKLPPENLAQCVHTVDSYQGREAKYVILDITVCTYRGAKSLGHGKYHGSRRVRECADSASSW